MSIFQINVEKDTLYVNSSGSIVGIISFSLDGYFFPEPEWYDFAAIILSRLAEITVDLLSHKVTSGEVSFMEGSFKTKITLLEDKICKIDLIEGEKLAGHQEIVHKSATISTDFLLNEIINACLNIIKMKKPKKINFNEDYIFLEKIFKLLNQFETPLT